MYANNKKQKKITPGDLVKPNQTYSSVMPLIDENCMNQWRYNGQVKAFSSWRRTIDKFLALVVEIENIQEEVWVLLLVGNELKYTKKLYITKA